MVEVDVVVSHAPPSTGGPEPVSEADTRARLLEAAAEVFAEKGYDKAGVAEIARRAGFTTGAIYSLFSGKAALLSEAIRTSGGDEFDELFAQHGFEGDATDILRTVGTHLVTRERNPVRALLLEAFVAARRDPEVRELLRDHLASRAARLASMVDIAKERGLVDPGLDTDAVVHFAHAVGLGFLLFEAVDMPSPDAEAWQDVVDRVLVAGMPPPPVPDPLQHPRSE